MIGNKIGNREIVFVSPGKFFVSNNQRHILTASLGSCVGVGLVEKKRGVGGLAHVLIHKTQKIGDEDCVFGENAVSVLLQQMERLGADRKSIVAGIAGGIAIDTPWINGTAINTIESIKDDLRKYNIELSYIEPIDHLKKSFVVDVGLKRISCVDPFWEIIKSEEQQDIKDISIKDAISKIKPMPQVVIKVISEIGNPYYNISEIVNELKKDDVIVARLLKYCNSPVFSPLQQVDSVEKAVIFLGSKNLLNVILTVYLSGYYKESAYDLQPQGMYNHSLAVGTISQKLCERLDIASDVGFTCGLLHDIGKKVLDELVKNRKKEYYKEIIKGRDSVDVERDMFNADHCFLGAYLAKMWNFPEVILNTIKGHHKVSEDSEKIVKVVFLANIMAHYILPGLVVGMPSAKDFDKIVESLGLGHRDLMKIIENLPLTMFSNEAI